MKTVKRSQAIEIMLAKQASAESEMEARVWGLLMTHALDYRNAIQRLRRDRDLNISQRMNPEDRQHHLTLAQAAHDVCRTLMYVLELPDQEWTTVWNAIIDWARDDAN